MGRLCLTRRVHETVVITVEGVQLTVTVLSTGRDRAALLFDCPEHVTVDREEVDHKKRCLAIQAREALQASKRIG
jgi:carbon storage regulator CsrA